MINKSVFSKFLKYFQIKTMDSALVKWLLKRNRENNPELNQKDIVILHQFKVWTNFILPLKIIVNPSNSKIRSDLSQKLKEQ